MLLFDKNIVVLRQSDLEVISPPVFFEVVFLPIKITTKSVTDQMVEDSESSLSVEGHVSYLECG